MADIKKLFRKITPLRTSTYERNRKETERQLSLISQELQEIKHHLNLHRENLDRTNRELLQLWKAMPIKPLEPRNQKPLVIASYTTFPARIEAAYEVAIMLLHQTVRPDRIQLWLAVQEFPNAESDLPKDLLDLRECGLEIRWCEENIKGHKKYYYAMKENPDAIVITFDDDLLYEADCIERLIKQHEKTPRAIVASRAHRILCDDDGMPLPYKQWEMCTKITGKVRMDIMATNGAGSLFPPHCLHEEAFNIDNIKKLALNTDDLWLKIMGMLQGTKTVSIQKTDLYYIENTQEQVLWKDNIDGGNNDRSLSALLAAYNAFPQDVTLLEMLAQDA